MNTAPTLATQPNGAIDSDSLDDALVAAIAAGNQAAAGILFTRHAKAIATAARGVVSHHDDTIADDAVSDVFLLLIDGRASTFQPARGRVLPWLKGIARNMAEEHLRGRTSATMRWKKERPKLAKGGSA